MTVTDKAAMADTLAGIGPLIRQWRQQKRLSQMALALDVAISPRPSAEVLLAIAAHLDVPLRTRNTWLLAAGYAPRFSEQSLDSDRMAQVRAALDKLLAAHDPYPGVVLDGHWNVVLANRAAQRLISLLPPPPARAAGQHVPRQPASGGLFRPDAELPRVGRLPGA